MQKLDSRFHIMNFLFFSLVLFSIFIFVLSNRNDDCLSLGFNPASLDCNTCETTVSQIFTEQSNIADQCLKCCSKISSKVEETYSKAVLEVDKRSIPFYPEIEAMLKLKKKLRFQVRYIVGNSPRLLMYSKDDDEAPAETISIQSWKKDVFEDFVLSHLKK